MALNPKTRIEHFIAGREGELPIGSRDPETRIEFFLAGREDELPAGHQEPESRLEHFIKDYRSGGDITVIPLTVTNNGDYTAPEGKAYSPVAVNVALPENAYLLKDIPSIPTAIATFADGAEIVMPSLKVAIEPQQEGSGDPSPTNIRPISGWDEVDVTVTDDVNNPTVSNVYTINLNGTRYGGTLDVVSGVLTVDRVSVTVDENSNIISGSGGLPFRVDLLTEAKASSSASAPTGVKCNLLKEVTQSSSWGVDSTFSRVTTDAKIVYFKVNSEITTIQQLKTFLQSNNLQFVYELATPLTIQLTPTAVKSLEGTNNVFADSGEILEGEYLGGVS